jgi:hypothetical protein
MPALDVGVRPTDIIMNAIFMKAVLIILPVMFLAAACEDPNDSNCSPLWWSSGGIDAPAVESVPDTIEIEGTHLYLSSEVWRNFEPMACSECSRLAACIRIIDCDSLSVPGSVDPQCLWIINGEKTWGSRFSDEVLSPHYPYVVLRIARCGPKWQTDILVDVIVKINSGDDVYFIRNRDVKILRAE